MKPKRIKIPSERQIKALWLQDVYGFKVKKIAELMKTTETAISNLLFEIRHNEDFMRRLPKATQKRQRRLLRLKPGMEQVIARKF